MKIIPPLKALPPRPTEIHDAPCERCPSAMNAREGLKDEESEDYKAAPREIQIESCFPCAWRPEKLCKEYCDFLSVTREDLAKR